MTGNRGRGSRSQVWVAAPVSGFVAREEPVSAAPRVRADATHRPTLLRPAAAVLSSPGWSGRDDEYVGLPAPALPSRQGETVG